jgi:iron(III) transport system ATP-binding protein
MSENGSSDRGVAIVLRGVTKAFGPTRAVRPTTLAVERGELFAVLGPSGCGKTTLLRLIAGFERPEEGSVEVGGQVMADGQRWVPPERRRIGMVFQDYALFPHLTVADNVRFGLGGDGRGRPWRLGRRARTLEGRARSALELVALQHKADRYPHQLSGGERQRVALARALAPEPAVVLLDEPFSSLDASLRAGLRREVELILREAEASAVFVTHDQEEALSIADRVAVMRDGHVMQTGSPEEVYMRPRDRWVASFVGEVNLVNGVADTLGVATELGFFDLAMPADPGLIRVAVRPEQLDLRPDDEGNATIADREFRGHDVLYRLHHETGGQVLVQRPSVELYEVGQKVRVRPGRGAVAPLRDERP